MTVENAAPTTLLDQFTPHYDFMLREHLLVHARPEETYERFSVLPEVFDWSFGVPVPLRPHECAPGFDEILANGRWTELGRRQDEEIVLGTAGRFWTSFSDWQQVSAQEFPTFSRPRRGTIAIAFVHRPYGEEQTLVTFEARATTTDAVAYRWADWYWHTIKPTARLVIREVLRQAAN
ncbi:hypothetical protein FHX82_002078 [Amycolatopsis bartoniae]|uniref:DUF2867 domain-containing protein n=1 Tax=Amycolatopsis bartoniae TaxID=941986 RepID=A0A8H9IW89_9PSEU|nr:hypothetical protein [Amycolatopsis bartoniae]MBB2935058.1 hypothetical protein [Amycolatopsis bartoniae]GHF74032.1 hypothetical protein GCM10017566_54740 [Amycolatopsis bartoniae]